MKNCIFFAGNFWVYPSCAFTDFIGRLGSEPERYGVAAGQHSRYWKSQDGENTYPVRVDRYRRFVEFGRKLGLDVALGYSMPFEAFIDFQLGSYYRYRGNQELARYHYDRHLAVLPQSKIAQFLVKSLEGKKV